MGAGALEAARSILKTAAAKRGAIRGARRHYSQKLEAVFEQWGSEEPGLDGGRP